MELKTVKNVMRKVGITLWLVLLSGCAGAECDRYAEVVASASEVHEIQAWSDSKIFSVRVRQDGLVSGGLVGPGKWRARASVVATLPTALFERHLLAGGPTLQVRLLGDDPSVPDAIFIGRKSFLGLIVARGQLSEAVKRLGISPQYISATNDRVAVLCFQD